MTRFLSALVLAAVPTGAFAQPKPNLYPLAEGNKWEFRVETGGRKIDATTEIIKSEVKAGKRLFTLESRIGPVTSREELSADGQGVYRHSFNGVTLDMPLMILQYPPRPGTWTGKTKADGMDLSFTMTMRAVAEVKVPAGTYKAVPVDLVGNVAGQKLTGTTWYADGVGVVKQSVTLGATEIQMELTKFSTLGK